ncbi:MAG: amidohydrolase family protein [Planctomycetota bacterium]|jgi:hypothetical protein
MLFPIKEIDKKFYNERLKNFLPNKIIDIHTHIWLESFVSEQNRDPIRTVTWPKLVAKDNPIEDLLETYRLMFPDKKVTPMIFANPLGFTDINEINGYVNKCAKENDLPSLIISLPQWSAKELEEKIIAGKFLGTKVYLNLAPANIPQNEITIFDFLPPCQLEVINKYGWIVMLHIPRAARLKDPVNLEQMLEIERSYPNVKLIIAHVGRAYCIEDVGNAFDVLSETKNMMFDFSANTNQQVFEKLLRAVGPKRVMFGSDLPITRMRMRRICENGIYVNLVPKGLYGDVSSEKNMREFSDAEAEKLTLFLYEQIDAFRLAAEVLKLTPGDIEDVFYNNAAKIIAPKLSGQENL